MSRQRLWTPFNSRFRATRAVNRAIHKGKRQESQLGLERVFEKENLKQKS
jgi:hypothetical protein